MKVIKSLAILLALLSSSSAWAGFTSPLTIRGLDVGDTGVLYINFEQNLYTGCNLTRVYVPASASYYQSMLAMALTSYANGTPISVWINDCNGSATPAVRMVQGTVW